MTKLTLNEAGRLLVLERAITAHKDGFIKAGLALEEIRDKKLYRVKYGTFEDYCLKKWGFGRSYGYQLIEDAKVAVEMSTIVDIPSAGAAKALAKVLPEQREGVVFAAQAARGSNKVTAASITKAATAAKPDIELDRTGLPVPHKALPFWNRRYEVQSLLTKVSQIKSALSHAQQNKDLLFIEVNFSSAIAYLENVFGHIKRAMPYVVCPICQGKLVEKCQLCKGRGLISELLYTQGVDEETKKLRMKAIKK